MKYFVTAVRIIVGTLFIFSGLIKANDPLGLSYKMQEFFEVWNESLNTTFFTSFNSVSLTISIIVITLEVIAGVALLLGWKMKTVSWGLLLLTLFFTFLTGYAYYSDKFQNCGCFGDCLPMTPLTSFFKDIILTALILFLIKKRSVIKPVVSHRNAIIILTASGVATLALQWYVLKYQPIVDCLPFKEGNNISKQMEIPADAIPDVYDISFIYFKDGKTHEFSIDQLPADISTYKFIDQKRKLVKKGKNNEPPIKGFSLRGVTGADSTQPVLALPKAFLIFADPGGSNYAKEFADLAKVTNNQSIFLASTQPERMRSQLLQWKIEIPVFGVDITAFRTAARVNPVVYLLRNGSVASKLTIDEHKKLITSYADSQ